MSTAAAAAELGADDGDHLDAFLAQQRVGVGVAVVGEDDPGRDAYQVGAAVPLGSLAHVVRAACLDDPHLLHAQGIGDGLDEGLGVLAQFDAAGCVGRTVGVGVDGVDDVGI